MVQDITPEDEAEIVQNLSVSKQDVFDSIALELEDEKHYGPDIWKLDNTWATNNTIIARIEKWDNHSEDTRIEREELALYLIHELMMGVGEFNKMYFHVLKLDKKTAIKSDSLTKYLRDMNNFRQKKGFTRFEFMYRTKALLLALAVSKLSSLSHGNIKKIYTCMEPWMKSAKLQFELLSSVTPTSQPLEILNEQEEISSNDNVSKYDNPASAYTSILQEIYKEKEISPDKLQAGILFQAEMELGVPLISSYK